MATPEWIATSGKFQQENGGLKWDELEKTAFDRIITSVHDFCLFMRDLYVPDDAILVPPESGWKEITTESLANLGKSDEVVGVLRHMTYIYCRGSDTGAYQILPDTTLTDYRSETNLKPIRDGDPERVRITTETIEPVPAHVIGLTQGGRGTAIILLDCKYGIVHWHGCEDEETKFGQHFKWSALLNDDDDSNWIQPAAWPIEEFFEYIKTKFRAMEYLPHTVHAVLSATQDWDEIMGALKEVYTKYGWPDSFHKAECAAAVEGLWQERAALYHSNKE